MSVATVIMLKSRGLRLQPARLDLSPHRSPTDRRGSATSALSITFVPRHAQARNAHELIDAAVPRH